MRVIVVVEGIQNCLRPMSIGLSSFKIANGMASWEKILHATDDGGRAEMQAPLIVSASRSTDIPAFYADWFFHRLRVGYSAWTNPFNGKRSYVAYDRMRFVVFWSKNPSPLLPYLPELKERKVGCYIQYTLNDYEQEGLEQVPALERRIDTFKQLVERLGMGAVVWRFDPMILSERTTMEGLLEKVSHIGDRLKGYTKKLVFSYADIAAYQKVRRNLMQSGIAYHEWSEEEMVEFARRLAAMNREREWNYQLATCGERVDLSPYGIGHNRCIDGDLIARLAWDDQVLMDYMKVKMIPLPEPTLFGTPPLPEGAIALPNGHYFVSTHRKDPGQRESCECMASKDIGEYNTCPHLCEYCYANASKELAMANWQRHKANREKETITGL